MSENYQFIRCGLTTASDGDGSGAEGLDALVEGEGVEVFRGRRRQRGGEREDVRGAVPATGHQVVAVGTEHAYTHTRAHTHAHTRTHARTHARTRTHTRAHTHARTRAHACIHAHTRRYICVHIHTRKQTKRPSNRITV